MLIGGVGILQKKTTLQVFAKIVSIKVTVVQKIFLGGEWRSGADLSVLFVTFLFGDVL